MAEENEYRVILVRLHEYRVDAGPWVYRGDRLPEAGDVITVHHTIRRDLPSVRARVNQVTRDNECPIAATELDDS